MRFPQPDFQSLPISPILHGIALSVTPDDVPNISSERLDEGAAGFLEEVGAPPACEVLQLCARKGTQ
jgi:hypothetical protein